MKKILFTFTLLVTSLSAWAKPQTVTLDLPTMNCAICPITVKKALFGVEGVIKAVVSYEDKKAVVIFDDTNTSIDKLIEATTNAGYPSTMVSEKTDD
jgi:mercuric ion binding protein